MKKGFARLCVLIFSLVMLLTSTVNVTFGYIVTSTDALINTFIPFESIVSSLVINKTVEHPLGENYLIPDNVSFDFDVCFGQLYRNTTITTTAGDMKADENGTITVSIAPNKPFGVEGIDAGTKVTVTEKAEMSKGFALKDGVTAKEGIISEDGSICIDFVNVYSPENVRGDVLKIHGTKVLEGREWREGDEFSFKLEANTEGNTWTLLGEKTIKYDSENEESKSFDFSDVISSATFDKVGEYKFRMTETEGQLENMSYDKTVHTFTVIVTDRDMDGSLEIGGVKGTNHTEVTKKDGVFIIDVTFNNIFVPEEILPPDDIEFALSVSKAVKNTGDVHIGPEGFEFILENEDGSMKYSAISDDDGLSKFTLKFTADDIGKTYTYKLYEVDAKRPYVTYDTTIYDITLNIVHDTEENKLIVESAVDENKVDSISVRFENVYHEMIPTAPQTGEDILGIIWHVILLLSSITVAVLIVTDKDRMLLKKR